MSKSISKNSQIDERQRRDDLSTDTEPPVYRFGSFVLDAAERVLRNGDEAVSLTPKAFDILLLLVASHGRLVTNIKLLETIWPDTFVEESTLTQNIFTLRKVLGVDAEGRQYIETVPKHGYRFRGDVELLTREQPLSRPRAVPPGIAITVPPAPAPRRWRLAAAVLLLAIAAVVAAVLLRRTPLADRALRNPAISRLTNGADVASLALSQDGKYVAYASIHGGRESLFVRQVDAPSAVEIVPPAPVTYRGITFSRDGNWIDYVTVPHDAFSGSLDRIPLLGGTPQRVMQQSVSSRVEISPDGSRLAFVRWKDALHTTLTIAKADGSAQRELATLPYDDGFSVDGPAWSPDGKTIVAATFSYNGSHRFPRLIAIDVATGHQRSFSIARWNWIGQIHWLADGSGIVLTAWSSDSDAMADQIWLVKYPGGEARRITNDINGYLGVGVSADAKVVAASTSIPSVNFWIVASRDAAQAHRITNGSGELYSSRLRAAWTPDGRIVFASRHNGKPALWIMDADGTQERQLTSGDGSDFQPAVAPDGRSIAFVSSRAGKNQLWRMNADGSDQRLVATMTGVSSPAFSADGSSIVFEAADRDTPSIWRVSAGGGAPLRLTRSPARMPAVSPDGKFVACLVPNDAPGAFRLALLDFATGLTIRQFDALVRNTPGIAWSPDGRALTYVVTRDGVSNIWSQPVAGGAPAPLTDFSADLIYRFAWSRDGRLLCERGTTVSDVILIRDSPAK